MDPLRPDDPPAIGGYRLLARLGAGGMGRVYLGRSARGRTVAVKVVHPELAGDPDFRRRFRHEVEAARRVGGTWTAPVLDADTETAAPWVATGYVPGPTLRATVGRHGPLPEGSMPALAAGLARALQAVHSCDLVHRDLKPTNVLITLDGPRVIDFGIARSVDASVATRTGAIVGSPGFMSPEQVRGQRLTPASDVFCLGSVLAYAATGREPFGRPDSGLHALMFRVAEEPPDLDGLLGPVRELAEACLAKDPDARPSLAEILTSLPAELPDPWLPAGIAADLGRHAARLLELEDPEKHPQPSAPPSPPSPPGRPSLGQPVPPPAPSPAPSHAPSPAPSSVPPGHRRSRLPIYLAAGAVGTVLVLVVALIIVLNHDRTPDSPAAGRTTSAADVSPSGSASGDVPAAMLGTWEGRVVRASTREQWLRRITLRQGPTGGDVGSVWSVNDDTLCEFRLTLQSAGSTSVELRTRTVRSFPAGRCGDGARQRMVLAGNGTVNWSSATVAGTLSQAAGDRVPERYRGRWWTTVGRPTGGSTAVPSMKVFEISDGVVGSEAIKVTLMDRGTPCEAMAILVSVEPAIVFFSSRALKGNCRLGGMQRIMPNAQDGGLLWEAPKQGQSGGLQRN